MLLNADPVFAAVPSSRTVSSSYYKALIQGARAGDYGPALAMLRQYGPAQPGHRRAAYDHILIARWANKNQEVIDVYRALASPRSDLPAAVLSAVASAYRDRRDWDHALQLYQQGIQRYPNDQSLAQDRVMTLADAGRSRDAMVHGRALVDKHGTSAAARLALAYAYELNDTPYAALYQASEAHTLAPGDSAVTRQYILALAGAGLTRTALARAKEDPAAVSAAELRTLQADYAATLTRLAVMSTRREVDRFAIADRALASYTPLIQKWQQLGAPAHDVLARIRIDRLQALYARMRMGELVREYEALQAEGITVPRYALTDVASAYLYLHQPEKAAAISRQALSGDAHEIAIPSDWLDTQTGLFYSLLESGSANQANAVIEKATTEQPTWLHLKGKPEKIPNALHLAAAHTAALGQFYSGNTAGAARDLEQMVKLAPSMTGLRTSLAQVYRSRQWPRRAERQLKMAETLAPRELDVEVEQGFTALALQEWHQAELLSRDTLARYPKNLKAQRLARDWKNHNKAELRVSGYRGITSNSPVSGNGDLGIDTVLYSAPIHRNWRVFGGGGYASGKFEEGDANYRWLRTGAQWRSRDVTAEAEVSTHSYGYGVKPGLRLSATYDIDDNWQIGASGEILSRDTPLRALSQDISSNALSATVRWRANDYDEWSARISPSHFSDGNTRIALDITGHKRIYTSPRLTAQLGLDISASHNSRADAPYFNPRKDLLVLPNIAFTHLLYQRYDTTLKQTLTLGGGTYAQEGYRAGAVGLVGYGLRYSANDVFEIGASVSGVSRPYDGARERDVRILFDMTIRF